MNRLRCLLILALVLLAACGGQSDDSAQVPTEFVLPTITITPTPWPTDVPTWTPTFTETLTETPTQTPTPTVTPSVTITDTPTPTVTLTATGTPDTGAVSLLALLAQQATILPQDFQPGTILAGGGPPGPDSTQQPSLTTCDIQPAGGFGTVYVGNTSIQQQLGCPTAYSASISSASQIFERGVMAWLQGAPNSIYVLTMTGSFTRYDDTYDANVDPYSGGEVPPPGLMEPVRGFGKVWRSFADVKSGLGWALTLETATQATMQMFAGGRMIYLPTRGDILVFTENPGGASGTWISVPGTF